MQANNKSDAAQVYEETIRSSKLAFRNIFKFLVKPLSIFSYHYFLEGIKAVQRDGTTKEIEKLTNLSYEETIRVMEKCQSDGVRIVAAERKLSMQDQNFGKKKSLFEQRMLTRHTRSIKRLSDFKESYPYIAKILFLDKIMKRHQEKQDKQIEINKSKNYNIYFNKSKEAYMGNRIKEIISYRVGISKELFDKETQKGIENIEVDENNDFNLNTQQLQELAEKFKIHEIGSVEIQEFKSNYCIHELPFDFFVSNLQNELDSTEIPYGLKVVATDNEKEKMVQVYFEDKHMNRYSELGFNRIGKISGYGEDSKEIEWSITSQDQLIHFETEIGEEERKTYSILNGKNYIMKKSEDKCIWTIYKEDLKELAEKEKKRDIVNEDIEKLNIFQNLQQNTDKVIDLIENADISLEKEVGD